MPVEESEWMRLPGVFRWSEVRDVFLLHAGWDDAWRFVVKADSATSEFGLLYAVYTRNTSVASHS